MDDRQSRLSEVARIAVALEAQTGCPAQLMIAQWALESKWGAKPVGHANYFGVKMAPRHKLCCTVTTHEVVDGERREDGSSVRRLRRPSRIPARTTPG